MQQENLKDLMKKHPFINDLDEKHLETLVGCTSNVVFKEGDHIFHEGESATKFYLIRSGRVALEIHAGEKGTIRVQTIGPGESAGWSALIAPYRLHFDATVVEEVRAFALDAKCIRKKSEADRDFGYEMLKRLTEILEERLEATRLQLLDIYGSSGGE